MKKRTTIELRLPARHVRLLKRVAKLAGVHFDVVVNVVLASYVIANTHKGKPHAKEL